MNGNAADVAAPDLDFTGVEAGAERQADLPGGGAERQRAAHGAAGSIERRQNAVAGVLHQISAMLLDDLLRQLIVTIKRSPPGLVTHRGRAASRINNIGEKDS